MWNNVVFKASFERVKKIGQGPFATYHMNENLGFMPTAEGLNHVNENHTLMIEKELSGPTFANLLHEISKCVQEEPQYWKNKPKSLLLTSSFTVAQQMTAKQAKNQPKEYVEATACHLPATELEEFLRLNKYMYGLSQYFSHDGLQKLLFHFFKTYSRSDLKPYTKVQLKRAKRSLKWSTFDVTKQQMKKYVGLNWTLTSLGMFKQLEQFDSRFLTEYRFYALKFKHEKQYLRYPLPRVHFSLSRIVPEKDYSECDLPDLDADFEIHRHPYDGPLEVKNHFFIILCAMEESMWRGSHHEVLAYGADLLCEPKFENHPRLEKYFLFVWGNMAVSLAKLHLPEIYPLSCLEKMIPKCFAFEIDAMHFKQQVMAAYEQYDDEEKIFLELLDLVPTYSAFYRKIVFVHMSATEKRLEDMLMGIYAMHVLIEENPHLGGCAARRIEKTFHKECDKHMKLMHVLCSITKSKEFCEDYEKQILMMKLYKEMQKCFDNLCKTEDFHAVASGLDNHVTFSWNLKIHVDSFEEYYQQMMDLKRELQKQTRMVYPKVWADVCYFHLLFLKALRDPQPDVFSELLYNDALYIYSNLDHPRAGRLETLFKKHESFEAPKFEAKVNPHCTIHWLVKNAPRVKGLVRNGISSAKKFDLWDASSYWKALR